ncbi:DUF4920 domain-containing protein [Ulvibacterium sp.]|uniref:DUF4920 domain-containing protein n=1 Tax=Ulvibacterium sp. TaxID=2665914 RepID=UPI0026016705|nr:DUF4920 domain-containing protein [Ulvibacterium sp.]
MKGFNILVAFLMLYGVGYSQNAQEVMEKSNGEDQKQLVFGSEIVANGAISDKEMDIRYQTLSHTDSLETKFRATVTDVCKVKGCWMKLRLRENSETMVRFKDYGFFVPKDIIGKEVVVSGTAFVEEISVADQKHFARDGGKSEKQIESISEPLKAYGFEAVGVLLKD